MNIDAAPIPPLQSGICLPESHPTPSSKLERWRALVGEPLLDGPAAVHVKILDEQQHWRKGEFYPPKEDWLYREVARDRFSLIRWVPFTKHNPLASPLSPSEIDALWSAARQFRLWLASLMEDERGVVLAKVAVGNWSKRNCKVGLEERTKVEATALEAWGELTDESGPRKTPLSLCLASDEPPDVVLRDLPARAKMLGEIFDHVGVLAFHAYGKRGWSGWHVPMIAEAYLIVYNRICADRARTEGTAPFFDPPELRWAEAGWWFPTQGKRWSSGGEYVSRSAGEYYLDLVAACDDWNGYATGRPWILPYLYSLDACFPGGAGRPTPLARALADRHYPRPGFFWSMPRQAQWRMVRNAQRLMRIIEDNKVDAQS